MKLSKRLQAVCDFIPENSDVIDVGANHALTDLYLTKYKNCKCLATDISEKSLEEAIKNIRKSKIKVQTMITNGLDNIDLNNEIIIITGMGIHTILDILNRKITNDLIISSNNTPGPLRKKLQDKGYRIFKEKVVFEKTFYVITYYKYKKGKKIDPYVSPYLIDNYSYMRKLLNFYQTKANNQKTFLKKMKYKHIVKRIKKEVK